MRKTIAPLVLLLMVSLMVGCNSGSQNSGADQNSEIRQVADFSVDASCRSVLENLDYSREMAVRIAVSDEKRAQFMASHEGVTGPDWDHAEVSPLTESLTDTERALLYGIFFDSRKGTSLSDDGRIGKQPDTALPNRIAYVMYSKDMPAKIDSFISGMNRPPADGVELLAFHSTFRPRIDPWLNLNNPEELNQFLVLDRELQLDYLIGYINPVTGKVFGRFDRDDWSAGEITMQHGSPEDAKVIEPQIVNDLNYYGEPIPDGTIYTLYGEQKDSMLFHWMEMNYESGSNMQVSNPCMYVFDKPIVKDNNPCESNPCTSKLENPCNNVNPCNPG